jgi:tRNA(Ile)-lysidine synthase
MINLLCNIPHKINLACSGGVDSMAVLDFLINGKKDVTVLYFNHGTEHSINVEKPLIDYCKSRFIKIKCGSIKKAKLKSESLEEYWRNERYNFFRENNDCPTVTCHHLDDAVETWLFTSLHGEGRLIPPTVNDYVNRTCFIRPFLLARKSDFVNWCSRKGVPFWQDESNHENDHARNYIRNVMMEHVLHINPGIHKVIKKKYLSNKDLNI